MKNTLIFLAITLLLSNCTSLEFEQPLPNDGQATTSLPSNLAGTYQNYADPNKDFKQYQHIKYIPKDQSWELYLQDFVMLAVLDTTKAAFVRKDSLFLVESDTSAPQFASLVKRVGDRYMTPRKLRYRAEPAKGKFVMYSEETGEPTAYKLILRKQHDVYFFNLQAEGASFWQTNTLRQTPQGIRLQYLSSPHGAISDLPFSTRTVINATAEGNSDTSYVAKPTDFELTKYMDNVDLLNQEDLIRVKEK